MRLTALSILACALVIGGCDEVVKVTPDTTPTQDVVDVMDTADATPDVTDVDVVPDAEPDADADADGEDVADADVDADAGADADADTASDADADAEPEVEPDVDVDVGPVGTPPSPGDLLITEIMVDPAVVSDANGEWFELTNISDGELDMGGCVVGDDDGDATTLPSPMPIPAGAYLVFGATAVFEANGGVPVDIVVSGLQLSNTTDELVITCGGAEIDAVRWNDSDLEFPITSGHALSYDFDAPKTTAANDAPQRWCEAPYPYSLSNYGSPGSPNPPCPEEDEAVDACRLVEPVSASGQAGMAIDFAALMFDEGDTDVSPAVDEIDGLLAQGGWGPSGSDPSAAPAGWTWRSAAGDATWNDASAPGFDRYRVTVSDVPAGTWSAAFRFSRNEGLSWTYCDLDGSDDGFEASQAGSVELTANACFPNPCTNPPSAICVGDEVEGYDPVGNCSVGAGGSAQCAYYQVTVDCAATLGTCLDGECTGGAGPPAEGEVIFSEILKDPDAVGDTAGEWFELLNVGGSVYDLDGCILRDDDSDSHAITVEAGLPIGDGQRLLMARSGDAATNGLGGLVPDYVYGDSISLANSGDELVLECDGVIVDEVVWDTAFLTGGGEYSAIGAKGKAMQLDPGAETAADNDLAASWCNATAEFGAGDTGTPGAANTPCDTTVTVDVCRLQLPASVDAAPGESVPAEGRVLVAGITDATSGVDEDPALLAELGLGPDGSSPSFAPDDWTWVSATGDAGWDDTADPGWDAYVAQLTAPGGGTWNVAFRVSADGGATWTACDLDTGVAGEDGSENGYQPANAGVLTVVGGSPCQPNPCDAPPAATCEGDVLKTYPATGSCTDDGGAASCAYPATTTNCAALGGTCAPTGCVVESNAPGPGDVVFTEVMYDPNNPSDPQGEWVELKNVTGGALSLEGCKFSDAANDKVISAALTIPAGGLVVLAHSDNQGLTGFTPDYLYGSAISLNNSNGDVLTLACPDGTGGDAVIDVLDYDDSSPFPTKQAGVSIALDPGAETAADNDDGANWCLSTMAMGTSGDKGSPGKPNEACGTP